MRRCGILLHPTSLPGDSFTGELGSEAYRFVDFLTSAGQKIWQTLPLGPTHGDLSPYQCLSSDACNPVMISTQALREKNILSDEQIRIQAEEDSLSYKHRCITQGWKIVQQNTEHADLLNQFKHFCDTQHGWLHDYALFVAIRNTQHQSIWTQWPTGLRNRDTKALANFEKEYAQEINTIKFEQFLFEQQWQALKHYANEKGIELVGDLPIFVALDSADAWSQQENFLLDENGQASQVAGVPPDYFSETGQRWGNPLYNWEYMEGNGFQWWKNRLHRQLSLFDSVRIDHFRGFEAYWSIPATEETAINGQWVKAPGEKLFKELQKAFGEELPLIAEDLGIITPEVDALRLQFNLPGMKILQFAFGGGADNPYLPHNHLPDYVVYTGTHDNDTTVGWYNSLSAELQKDIYEYFYCSSEDIHWLFIAAAMASVANTCIVPLQDVLGLDTQHRMNTPGTTEGNWRWRFEWELVNQDQADKMRKLCQQYRR